MIEKITFDPNMSPSVNRELLRTLQKYEAAFQLKLEQARDTIDIFTGGYNVQLADFLGQLGEPPEYEHTELLLDHLEKALPPNSSYFDALKEMVELKTLRDAISTTP